MEEERINLVVEQKPRAFGVTFAVAVSFVLHGALFVLFIRSYHPAPPVAKSGPIARYVELIRQNPKEFVEAPGRKIDQAPINAPFSDANRRASTPRPTGEVPTTRPGDGSRIYTPPSSSAEKPQQAQQQQSAQQAAAQQTPGAQQAATISGGELNSRSRIPALRSEASSMAGVNWRSAIKEAAQIASISGEGIDLRGGGGEKGFAEAGPLSFETQWYDWGEYAQSMVSKIRVNWYANMPQLIRTGMKGVVTIRFTIQRDGRITDITTLDSSTIPPYDFAARKAIELSSPLAPLPKDFPNPDERVTAMFYYNSDPPSR